MEDGWSVVYRSGHEYQASLVLEILEQHGLHPVLLDHKDDEFHIGEVEVYVAPEEAEQAAKIISENVVDDMEDDDDDDDDFDDLDDDFDSDDDDDLDADEHGDEDSDEEK
jgi:Putative prokaryotic signal transducing protein